MDRPRCFVLYFVLTLGACSSREVQPDAARPPRAVGGDVLATVDGVPITRAQVALATGAPPAGHGEVAPVSADAVLERLVQQEVLAQRALATHADRDADFLEELAVHEAQLDAWKRERLAQLYAQYEGRRRPPISEADARQYYDANITKIRTEVRVGQILLRDRARAEAALRDLRAGASFDEVAARQFPSLPDPTSKPWELAPLRWNQLPAQWSPVIDGIAVGQTSELIVGGGSRFWILKVLERRENPELTFEATRPLIGTLLREQGARDARTHLVENARAAAHIVYAHPPAAVSAAATEP